MYDNFVTDNLRVTHPALRQTEASRGGESVAC